MAASIHRTVRALGFTTDNLEIHLGFCFLFFFVCLFVYKSPVESVSHWKISLCLLPWDLTQTKKIQSMRSWELFSSVHLSRSVVSNSLRPHESEHARPPCPTPTPGIHLDCHPSSQWCHPAISSSVVPFSSCPQSLPASESFPMSQFFTWGGQSIGVSALASFLPKKSQGWPP